MAASSWEMLIEQLGESKRDGSTTDNIKPIKPNKAMNCSCSKTHSVFDNPKGADKKKDVINSVEKIPSFFDSLFVSRTETKKEFIPAKRTYPFFDKHTEVSDKQKETYTEEDVLDPAELMPLFSIQNSGPKK